MTIVISCLTPDVVYQVSDRRLTALNGTHPGMVLDDERNKAVLVDGRMAFAYTGLASLPGASTDDWLTRTLADGRTDDLGPAVGDSGRSDRSLRTDRLARRAATTRVSRHRLDSSSVESRFCASDHHHLERAGLRSNWLPEAASEFKTRVDFYEGFRDGFALDSVGQTLSAPEKKAIWRLIRRCARHRAGPAAYLRSLLTAVRWLASRHSTIGPSMMGMAIPRMAVERAEREGATMALLGPPTPETATFLYVPASGSQQVAYGPHFIAGGMAMMGFTVRPATQ